MEETPNNEKYVDAPKRKLSKIAIISIILSIMAIIAIAIMCLLHFGYIGNKDVGNLQDTSVQQESVPVEISYPYLTEKGVEPFTMGTLISDISYKSTWYDTIIWCRQGGIVLGDAYIYFGEEEMEEYMKYGEPIDIICKGEVMLHGNTLMTVETDETLHITSLTVSSNKLCLVNGIHVGSSTEMIDSAYHNAAVLYDTWPAAYDPCYYDSPEIPCNMRLYSSGENRGIYDYAEKCNAQYGDIVKIPIKYAKGDTVTRICIN